MQTASTIKIHVFVKSTTILDIIRNHTENPGPPILVTLTSFGPNPIDGRVEIQNINNSIKLLDSDRRNLCMLRDRDRIHMNVHVITYIRVIQYVCERVH